MSGDPGGPGNLSGDPGNVCRKGLKFPEIPGNLQGLVHNFFGSVEFFFVSSHMFPGSPDRFPGPPGPPDMFPVYIGPFPGLLLMERLIFNPRLVQWSGLIWVKSCIM